MIGTTLNQFRITAKLGQGGMGEVYRAADTKLGRDVAIKVLPATFTNLPESAARFEREAKALATLNHPGIASIHGFDVSHGTHFLVMELVEGETLEERLKRGPLPIDEALDIARQIAEALEGAHECGIIHRDLKPSNIKITPQGRLKLLDFGLAKATELSSNAALADSPTILGSIQSTMPGFILGTAAYMSPEQARGKAVDHRSDIWSFGVVLFECLTGRKLFSGESVSDILASVLKSEIDWKLLPAETPLPVQWLLRKCLNRDKKQRLQNIADARVDLDEVRANPLDAPAFAGRQVSARKRGLFFGLTALSVLAAFFAGSAFRKTPSGGPAPEGHSVVPQTYTLNLHPDAPLGTFSPLGSAVILAPDCSKIVYVGVREGTYSLYWKGINDSEFKVIPQSAQAAASAPIFCPSSDKLAFWGRDRKWKIFSFQGGLPASVHATGDSVQGAQWPEENQILYTTAKGLYRMNLDNPENPELLLASKDNPREVFQSPRLMPGGKTVLLSVARANRTYTVEGFDLQSKERRPINLSGPPNFEFEPATSHLLYGRDDVLWARLFDPVKLQFGGAEFPLIKDLGRDWAARSHQFTIARNGTLVYARGHQTEPRYNLVWVKSQGEPEILPVPPGDYRSPKISPDGNSAVVLEALSTLHLVHFSSGVASALKQGDAIPSTTGYGIQDALLGSAFAYDGTNAWVNRAKGSKLVVVRTQVDSRSSEQEIFQADLADRFLARALSPNGKYLALQKTPPESPGIFLKDLNSNDEPRPFAADDKDEVGPAFSPDSEWLAFSGRLTDRSEIYVRKVPDGGLPIQVSRNSGYGPVWSRDGARLYFREASKIMVARVKSKRPLAFEPPTLFATGRFRYTGVISGGNYDVFTGPDGDRLLTFKSVYEEPEPQGATHVTAIVHFDKYLRERPN